MQYGSAPPFAAPYGGAPTGYAPASAYQGHPQGGFIAPGHPQQQQQMQMGMPMQMGGGMMVMGHPQQQQVVTLYQPGFQPANPTAFALFMAVDADRSGSISQRELHAALSNGGWTAFSPRTTRLLIKMFDSDHQGSPGQLSYPEFERLLGQLSQWRAFFDSADHDRSGRLSLGEVAGAVRSFGFNIPDPAIRTIFSAFANVGADGSGQQLAFDEYIQLIAEINALTALFRRFDPSNTGMAHMDYGNFMSVVFATRT
jgi:Ca2+-binding EF-hand superfamily protein